MTRRFAATLLLPALALLMLAACASNRRAGSPDHSAVLDSLRSGTWTLAELNGAAVNSPRNPPSLTFEGERVTGSTGVNQLSAPYTATPTSASGGIIAFADFITTKMAGPPEAMNLEQQFVAALAEADEFSADANTLTLLSDGKPVLQFVRHAA